MEDLIKYEVTPDTIYDGVSQLYGLHMWEIVRLKLGDSCDGVIYPVINILDGRILWKERTNGELPVVNLNCKRLFTNLEMLKRVQLIMLEGDLELAQRDMELAIKRIAKINEFK